MNESGWGIEEDYIIYGVRERERGYLWGVMRKLGERG